MTPDEMEVVRIINNLPRHLNARDFVECLNYEDFDQIAFGYMSLSEPRKTSFMSSQKRTRETSSRARDPRLASFSHATATARSRSVVMPISKFLPTSNGRTDIRGGYYQCRFGVDHPGGDANMVGGVFSLYHQLPTHGGTLCWSRLGPIRPNFKLGRLPCLIRDTTVFGCFPLDGFVTLFISLLSRFGVLPLSNPGVESSDTSTFSSSCFSTIRSSCFSTVRSRFYAGGRPAKDSPMPKVGRPSDIWSYSQPAHMSFCSTGRRVTRSRDWIIMVIRTSGLYTARPSG
ncbi:hypothetical protein VIGAN_05260600 [Vigna angularis var. angularis]|uniref:Uncharacterized protein n=1 Tax=Vigna angularis var. angularis TaxID=157739 RepID=A0A0S3S7Y5_PHAAN|nr:hypothetical protein VIGAN_05260600 [Vigna angularis var. angularis]